MLVILWIKMRAPVDLAIGSAIQVTFPFTPNDFSQFTGNGPLRFGLYDYR